MTDTAPARRRHRTITLTVFLMVQVVAVVFFVGDVVGDLRDNPSSTHFIFEALVTAALAVGVFFGARALNETLAVMRAQETALAAASGALSQVIADQFTDWRLTPAERDVGMLALKGLDVAEISQMRSAAAGTVRAQLARIYAKAGVSGRAQFAAFFVEDLLGQALPEMRPG